MKYCVLVSLIIFIAATGCSLTDANVTDKTSLKSDSTQIYNISKDEHDATLDLLSNWNGAAMREVWADGHYAYLAGYGSYIYIVDVKHGDNPELASSLYLGTYGDPIDIITQGHYAYVATRNGVCIVDITDKSNPYFVSYTSTPGTARRMEIQGEQLFLADGYNGIIIFDVTDKSSPSVIATSQAPIEARKVFYRDGFVYVADVDYGLRIFSFNGNELTLVSSLATDGGPDDVYVHDNYAYLADRYNGVLMIDIRDKANPSIQAHLVTGGMTGRLFVRGSRLYCVDRDGVYIMNILKKQDLEIVSSMKTPDQSIGIHLQANRLFVAGDIDGLFIYRIDESGNHDGKPELNSGA
ncbi:MAG: hypothetical protein R6U31_00135 [bacterium]